MKLYRYLLLLGCLPLIALTASGQSQEQAKRLFNEGKYAAAKPAFQKLVKRYPKNGSSNYWFGACLYETGEADKCLPYLELAAERDVREANRYLAMYYSDNYQFEESEESWETYFELMEKAKKPTDVYQAAYDYASLGRQMMRSVKDITIVDSVVMDKNSFLRAYNMSKEAGSLTTFNQFFNEKNQTEGIVYQTETKNKIYYSSATDGKMRLYTSDMLTDKWENGKLLKGLNENNNNNYPYILSDGATLYFASDGSESLGGYDIFITRYNSERNQFLRPENIGMPFNSPANDYMLVIDEFNTLGWFASDRNQPEGNVCIYTFIPNKENKTLDEELVSPEQLRNRAQLTSIKDTWKNEQELQRAKQRIASVKYSNTEQETIVKDFELVIDDLTTYHTLKDFRSKQARDLATRWMQEVKNLASLSNQLEQRRTAYAQANANQRNSMKAAILDLEQRVRQMEQSVARLEMEARNTENRHLGKK